MTLHNTPAVHRQYSVCMDNGSQVAMMQANNPLHGITLEAMVTNLQEHYGWEELGKLVNINCFQHEPSVKSSLKFLRKTPWARNKVEALYLKTFT